MVFFRDFMIYLYKIYFICSITVIFFYLIFSHLAFFPNISYSGYRKKICVVGKPYPESPINHPTVWRRFLKYSVKAAIYPKFESCNVISSQCAQSEFKNQIATAKCGRFESNGSLQKDSL